MDWIIAAMYLVPLVLGMYLYVRRHNRMTRAGRARLEVAVQEGLIEPPSLHPVIDHAICIGSGSCVRACPEQSLTIIRNKGVLANPSHCIGHGACAASCPVSAITLVFGTERRGVDIPYVKPTFETNVAGVYIAGELGGMGLVGKSAQQGRQAVESIVEKTRPPGDLDLVIVGAGPAGLSASLAATAARLRYVTIEQEDSLGGTIYHYPRNKIVMTHPLDLPLAGRAVLGAITKESLLDFWQRIVDEHAIDVRFGVQMIGIEREDDRFLVETSAGPFRTANVLIAIGRRGTPRKLGVPGEASPKVVYRLIEPGQYRGRRVLVVGGGDTAIEAALALAGQDGTDVTLSYRGDAFSRAKPANRDSVMAAGDTGAIRVLLGSSVQSIEPENVVLAVAEGTLELANDVVIVCAGGVLPTGLLKDIGVIVETKFGEA